MLHEFVTTHRQAIAARAGERATRRAAIPAAAVALEDGAGRFLDQLSETLLAESTPGEPADDDLSETATLHGRELLALGLTVSEVVHDYGEICQAVTELAIERNTPITTQEFRILNRCLDTAIAKAVTEHTRLTAEARSADEIERLGRVAHEVRNRLHTALLAFGIVKGGGVLANDRAFDVLDHSLIGLREFVNGALAEIRTAASHHRPEPVSVHRFFSDIGVAAQLQAEDKGVGFDIEPVDPGLVVHVDPLLLEAAVMNLLSNGFKYTHPGGLVTLRAHGNSSCAIIDVEDSCGGLTDSDEDPFKPFAHRAGRDRTGLGLGLAIARRAVRAQGGDVRLRNLPGRGCIFTIELPLAPPHGTTDAVPAT